VCRDDVSKVLPSISDECTNFSHGERVVILQGDLVMNYFSTVGSQRIFEFELGFHVSGEAVKKVKVTAISYQLLPSHITYRQVIR